MNTEEKLEALLLSKSYDELSLSEMELIRSLDWTQADYIQERKLRLGLTHWAKAQTEHRLPATKTWPVSAAKPHLLSRHPWLLAASWVGTLFLASIVGFWLASLSPPTVVSTVEYRTDTVFLWRPELPINTDSLPPQAADRPVQPIASKQTVQRPKPNRPTRTPTQSDQPKSDSYSSRSMAADNELMKFTSKVW